MTDSPEPILAARDAWRAAMAAYEAQRLEVNRLWLAYLELADPGRAPKIRRFLKHGEKDAAKPVDVLFPAAVSLGGSIPRPQELDTGTPEQGMRGISDSAIRYGLKHLRISSRATIGTGAPSATPVMKKVVRGRQ